MGTIERPKPVLHRFFEAIASIMNLDRGRQRLELIFEDGRLTQWWVHAEKRSPATLDRFDEQADWIILRGGAR